MPFDKSKATHDGSKSKLRAKFQEVCGDADLSRYAGSNRETGQKIWRHLWRKNRYAGIMAKIASKEISDIAFLFDDFTVFSNPTWDIVAKGHQLVSAGPDVQHFLKRTGPFSACQTIGNLPKLQKIVAVARSLNRFLESKSPEVPVLNFLTNGASIDTVWSIHEHLLSIGYTSDLTALHFMMDLGFQVIKPDVVISRQFLEWGWLHLIIPSLPRDLSVTDIEGTRSYTSQLSP
jgi:hypothetical protein